MAQYNITLNEAEVRELFLGNASEAPLARLMKTVLDQLLEARAEDLCGAERYEQSEDRVDYRNGYRSKSITTRIGKIELELPRLRGQSLLSGGLFEAYKRSEQALMSGIAEMVVQGVSTRKIDSIAQELFGSSVSKSQVSRVCELLDPVVEEFRSRPLEACYPFMIVDAIYIKVREDGRIVSKALYIAMGVNMNGQKEVLGFMLAGSENTGRYKEFFNGMKSRGLERIDFVVSDDHSGLVTAVKEVFLGASWQRCQTHFSRNMMDRVPKKLWPDVKERLREIYTAKDIETAKARKEELMEYLSTNAATTAAELLDEAFDDITAVLSLPTKYRKALRTSNHIERLNEEVRRRERVIRIFPTDGSVMRILGSVLSEQHDKWSSGKRLFDMNEYLEFIDEFGKASAMKCDMKEAA